MRTYTEICAMRILSQAKTHYPVMIKLAFTFRILLSLSKTHYIGPAYGHYSIFIFMKGNFKNAHERLYL